MFLGSFSIIYPFYLFFVDSLKGCCTNAKDRAKVEMNYNVDYDELRPKFPNEYDRANPITKEEALVEYFEFIKSTIQ